ncbi:MAG: glycoside hydrolase family 57 protein [Candidatus Lernaella stagnicola]|nr:glycoside hydrolase family 57 protein [Candidatus Lernaella stagnicola]
MTQPLRVAFLWHMHQPYYLDDPTGDILLPWVRLHATKAYHDMNAMLTRHPEMACTINVVPSLLAQISAYGERDDLDDTFLRLSRTSAADLTEEERRFVLRYFFMSNWDTMVRRHPGYARLLDRRGHNVYDDTIDRAVKLFSTQDLRDLQVWFNLSWFGFTAQRDKRIAPLIRKGTGFSEVEKALVLDVQAEIVNQIIPAWKKLLEDGRVEISTTPMYHPILPILVGSEVVRRSMPNARLPGEFAFPADAKAQIDRGVAYYTELFGQAPAGMWPSEGSVCPELIPFWSEAGLKWVATDEAVLFRSLGGAPRSALFEPYIARHGETEVAVFFRDRYLSDLIGFTYAKNDPSTAVADFIGHLSRIQQSAPGGTVSIILDGENPWEYYPDGGERFLDLLYSQLVADTRFRPVSLRQALDEHPPRKTIDRLHSGSWINADFGIWIGGREENQGWALIDRTRSHLVERQQSGGVDEKTLAAAFEQLYQAEGSDWFWWYDDDFTSDNDADFDHLFRQKLANAHRALGETPPHYLEEPIHVTRREVLVSMPLALIQPEIDGKVTHFYEWADAGALDLSKARGSMHLSKSLLDGLYFGFDTERFYLRLDPSAELLGFSADLEIRVHFVNKREWQIRLPLVLAEGAPRHFSLWEPDSEGSWRLVGNEGKVGAFDVVEIAVPTSLLNWEVGEKIGFVVQIVKGDVEEDRFPKNGRISVTIPDAGYDSVNWSV